MLNKLEKALGYKFRDPELLRMALTHTSCANEIYQDPLRSYERLEFLGDSIVGFVTAEYLYRTFPKKLEGDLSAKRALPPWRSGSRSASICCSETARIKAAAAAARASSAMLWRPLWLPAIWTEALPWPATS